MRALPNLVKKPSIYKLWANYINTLDIISKTPELLGVHIVFTETDDFLTTMKTSHRFDLTSLDDLKTLKEIKNNLIISANENNITEVFHYLQKHQIITRLKSVIKIKQDQSLELFRWDSKSIHIQANEYVLPEKFVKQWLLPIGGHYHPFTPLLPRSYHGHLQTLVANIKDPQYPYEVVYLDRQRSYPFFIPLFFSWPGNEKTFRHFKLHKGLHALIAKNYKDTVLFFKSLEMDGINSEEFDSYAKQLHLDLAFPGKAIRSLINYAEKLVHELQFSHIDYTTQRDLEDSVKSLQHNNKSLVCLITNSKQKEVCPSPDDFNVIEYWPQMISRFDDGTYMMRLSEFDIKIMVELKKLKAKIYPILSLNNKDKERLAILKKFLFHSEISLLKKINELVRDDSDFIGSYYGFNEHRFYSEDEALLDLFHLLKYVDYYPMIKNYFIKELGLIIRSAQKDFTTF